MPRPRLRIRGVMVAVAVVAAWLGLLRAWPAPVLFLSGGALSSILAASLTRRVVRRAPAPTRSGCCSCS